MRIAPYILAGGRSSRMGRDKAMIVLGGKTMLARTVETLRAVRTLVASEGNTRVTVLGNRQLLEGADRSISDRYPGCGPLGGMEAALNDLTMTDFAEFALFVPVDMPFLPGRLIDAMLREWIVATRNGASVCHVAVDGRPQPLVSLVHRDLHPWIVEALHAQEYKVTPVLQSAAKALASQCAGTVLSSGSAVWQSLFTEGTVSALEKAWRAAEREQGTRHLWFANLNTPEELREAEALLAEIGRSRHGNCASDEVFVS